MKTIFNKIVGTVFGICFMLTQSSLACSVSPDFVRPSNFVLVQLADAIVIAKPLSQKRIGRYDHQVNMTLESVLKGEIRNKFKVSNLRLGKPIPSIPNDISSANPEAYSGPCARNTLKRGGSYVLFLKQREGGGWRTMPYAFSRDAEDYFGQDSLWIQTIKYYLAVQESYSPMEQLEVLDDKLLALVETKRTPNDQKLAVDIADHLASRSPYKPTQYLRDTYEALVNNRELPFAVRGPTVDKEGVTADAVTALVFGPRGDDDFNVDQQKQFVLWALVNGDHPDAMPLFERLSLEKNQSGPLIGVTVRFFAKHGRYHDAIDIANANAFRIMNNAPIEEVRQFLRGVLSLDDAISTNDKERWEDDEYARDWWPEFALALNSNLRARFGNGYTYTMRKEAQYLRPKNYREKPNVAMELVRSYDDDVVEWAKQEIQKLQAAGEKGYKDSYSLPIKILLQDYRPDNGDFVQSLICAGGDKRYLVLKYLGLQHTHYTVDLAAQIAVMELNDDEKETLMKSLSMFAAEERKTYLQKRGWGSDDALELIISISHESDIDLADFRVQPLKCH